MLNKMEELRNERLAEYGVTKEQAQAIKELLEANNYKVDMDYFWSIRPNYERYMDEPHTYVQFTNNLFMLHTSSSHWEFSEAKKFAEQVGNALVILNTINSIAPTVVDPSFRNKRIEEQRAKNKTEREAKIAKWNTLPERETILTLSTGAELVQVRSKAEYREGYRTEFWLGYELNGQRFAPSQFLTRDGKVQRKKFIDWHKHIPAQDVETLLKMLVSLDKKSNEARNGSF